MPRGPTGLPSSTCLLHFVGDLLRRIRQDVVPLGQRLLRVEGALAAGDTLADDLGVLVDEHCHQRPFDSALVIARDKVFIFIGDPSVAISAKRSASLA